jgi:hypothetical protein
MAGVHSPVLNISELISGPYIFELTVADNSGGFRFEKKNVRKHGFPNYSSAFFRATWLKAGPYKFLWHAVKRGFAPG